MNTEDFFVNSKELPSELSKEETYELILKAQNGDINARNKLIEHNIRLVLYEINKKFMTVDYDKKELVSIGISGLFYAINNFSLEKNLEFSTYAIKCIDSKIYLFIKRLKKYKNIDSLDRPISTFDKKKETYLGNILEGSNNIDDFIKIETYKSIRNIINSLPDKERMIIMLSFGFNEIGPINQNEIADIVGLSRSRVSKIRIDTLEKIKVMLFNDGLIEVIPKRKVKKNNIYN